jgi:ribonucleoside-diphosphate reductase alpha chain
VIDVVRRMLNTRFEPSGFTGDPDVPVATSLADYIARRLAVDHLSREELDALIIDVPAAQVLAALG